MGANFGWIGQKSGPYIPRLGTMKVLLIDLEALAMARRYESQLSLEIAEDNVEDSARLLADRVRVYAELFGKEF